MPLNVFYTIVQKSQKWPKTQIKGGGPALSFNALFMAHVSCNVMDLLSFPWCVLLWMHTFPFPFSSFISFVQCELCKPFFIWTSQ